MRDALSNRSLLCSAKKRWKLHLTQIIGPRYRGCFEETVDWTTKRGKRKSVTQHLRAVAAGAQRHLKYRVKMERCAEKLKGAKICRIFFRETAPSCEPGAESLKLAWETAHGAADRPQP